MKRPERWSLLTAWVVLAALVVACGGAAAEEPLSEEEEAPEAEEAAAEEREEAAPADFFEEESFLEEPPVPAEGEPSEGAITDADTQLAEAAAQETRLVIKDGFITLHVTDIDQSLAQISNIAGRYGGYVLSSENTQGTRSQSAEITIAVRSEDFDTAMSELRAMAVEVLNERVEGQDVTSEFVDLEARLRNLEATAERLRSFLDDAQTVEEALTINEELASIEAEIEEVRGRINYLQTRSAQSTITASLLTDPRPTATPTITPTPTNTPTPTPTPTATPTSTPTPTPTPAPWSPVEAVRDATHIERNILRTMLRSVTEALIFLLIVIVPTLLPFVAIGLGLYFGGRAVLRWWESRKD